MKFPIRTQSMLIEAATLEDAHDIARVHVLSWQRAYKDIFPAAYLDALSVAERESMWRASLIAGRPQLLVARSAGAIIGFAAFGSTRDEAADPRCAELWAIYLDPAQWRRGVGRALWSAAYESIAAQGFDRVSLWVLTDNKRAIRFYEAAGFVIDASSARDFSRGGVEVQEVRALLAIGA